MRMHDPRTRDPIITMPEPLPLMLPVIEATLRWAGVRADRSAITDRFMGGAPRVAVVYGSPDHPAQVDDMEIARRAIAAVWERDGVPFAVAEPAICDGVAQGHEGMSYSLLSRNLTASMLLAQFIAHGYQAALVLGSCDKRPVGDLAALIEADQFRRKAFGKPLPAVFIPANVMPEIKLPRALRQEVIQLLEVVDDDAWRQEIHDLLAMKLKCNTYAMFKKLLDNLVDRGRIEDAHRNALEKEIAQYSCVKGGTCAFIGTGNTDKFMLAALGLVPSRSDFLRAPADRRIVGDAIGALMDLVEAADPAHSVSALVDANLANAMRVWCAVGGSTNWALHFPYLARLVGRTVRPKDLARLSAETPHLIEINPLADKSMFTLANEVASGESSGIDTLVAELFRRGLFTDAPTVRGDWKSRIAGARAANNRIFFREARRPTSGIVELTGNICESAVVKMTGIPADEVAGFDDKVYLAVCYLGESEGQQDLFDGALLLKRLATRVPAAKLKAQLAFNFPDRAAGAPREKSALFDWLVRERLLRILVVIAGEGPKAHGIPEMYYPSEYLNRDVNLRYITALLTDARYSGATYGPCIGHGVPEAMDGGGIGALKTGDLIHVDFSRGRMNILGDPGRDGKRPAPMSGQQLRERPELARNRRKLENRAQAMPLSVRGMLADLLPATEGCGPR